MNLLKASESGPFLQDPAFENKPIQQPASADARRRRVLRDHDCWPQQSLRAHRIASWIELGRATTGLESSGKEGSRIAVNTIQVQSKQKTNNQSARPKVVSHPHPFQTPLFGSTNTLQFTSYLGLTNGGHDRTAE